MYGVSKDKFINGTTIPKRAGNFSKFMMHFVSKSYPVCLRDGKVIIGNNTPGETILSDALVELMKTDKFFREYRQEGVYRHNGKDYKCWRSICRSYLTYGSLIDFTFTMSIDTLGDFKFEFPNL